MPSSLSLLEDRPAATIHSIYGQAATIYSVHAGSKVIVSVTDSILQLIVADGITKLWTVVLFVHHNFTS